MTASTSLAILLVEDNATSRDSTIAEIHRVLPGVTIHCEADAEGALRALAEVPFDLAICDLKIPQRPNQLSTSEEHGQAVISRLLGEFSHVPVIVLSAYAAIENTERFTSTTSLVAGLGVDRLPECQVVVKGTTGEIARRIQVIADGLKRLASVSVTAAEEVSPLLDRAVRQFALSHRHSDVLIESAGGLSGSENAFVTSSAPGKPSVRSFVKLDETRWIREEIELRQTWVEGTLPIGHWAPVLAYYEVGLRGKSASFSTLATGTRSLFAAMKEDPAECALVIGKLFGVMAEWSLGGRAWEGTIGDLRSLHVSDQVLLDNGVDRAIFADVEELNAASSLRVCHGDFHGDNVLVNSSLSPILIDFAYTGEGAAPSDAVALELSLIFHPASPLNRVGGVDVDLSSWAEGDYLGDSPLAVIVAACRDLGLSLDGERAFFENAYAHSLRQLKHSNVDRHAAVAVATAAANKVRKLAGI